MGGAFSLGPVNQRDTSQSRVRRSVSLCLWNMITSWPIRTMLLKIYSNSSSVHLLVSLIVPQKSYKNPTIRSSAVFRVSDRRTTWTRLRRVALRERRQACDFLKLRRRQTSRHVAATPQLLMKCWNRSYFTSHCSDFPNICIVIIILPHLCCGEHASLIW